MRRGAVGVLVLSAILCAGDVAAQDVAALLAAGKAGATVTLPAGTFAAGDLVVPAGVSVRGAGYGKTILDAAGHRVGLRVSGGEAITVSDFTLRGATAAALHVEGGTGLTAARLRLLDSGVGLRAEGVSGARFENLVIAGNGTGGVLRECQDSVFANCTAADNRDLAISLAGNRGGAVFNNLFINSQLGMYDGGGNERLAVDCNLYVALFVGGLAGQPTRESLAAWRALTGFDRRSVELPVQFADPARRDYRPVLALPWCLARATTADWGTAELAGFAAPPADINGNARSGGMDLGAFETTLTAPRPPDGSFTVHGGGVTSAGLFTPDGTLLAYLFHNLPLARARHDFWLPPRTHDGTPIPAGRCELRTSESDLSLEYVGMAANGGVDSDVRNCASLSPEWIVFDADGNVILVQAGIENHQHVRGFDRDLARHRWIVSGGGGCQGATVDENGVFFRLGNGEVLKVEAATGRINVEGRPGVFRRTVGGPLTDKVQGLAALGGRLFVADPEHNRILFADSAALDFAADKVWSVTRPVSPAADLANGLLWVVAENDRLVALDAKTGVVRCTARPVEKPWSVAVCGGRLAVASAATRRIHIFDCTDPADLKALYTVGSGRDPRALGPIGPTDLTGEGEVAIDRDGRVATTDGNVRLFGPDGRLLRWHTAFWGQFTPGGWWTGADRKPEFHLSGMHAQHTVVLDVAARTWRPGVRFSLPDGTPPHLVCLFTAKGANFAVYSDDFRTTFHVLRFDDWAGRLVRVWAGDKPNGGFVETAGDRAAPLLTPDGRKVEALAFKQDGRLFAGGCLIPRTGLAPDGAPQWDWTACVPKPKPFGEGGGGQGQFNFDVLPNGAWIRDEGPGRGFGGGFTTFAAYNPDGTVRWKYHNDHHCTLGALRSLRVFAARSGEHGAAGSVGDPRGPAPTIVTAMATEELDLVAIDQDGLGLGVMGVPKAMNWNGFWHDQDWSMQGVTGPDGQPFLTLGDYTCQGYHWLAIAGAASIRHAAVPVVIDEARAAALSLLGSVPMASSPAPPTPRIVVRKLANPMTVDGDLAKWRDLGIAPQIVHVPGARPPDDVSALIRMAWQGDDLYVQVIKFDDVVSFHQPLSFHYKQDSTELALIGGFMGGYKFAITRTTDAGDVLYREQFLMKKELNLEAAKAPRVIRVLDSARDVEERALIEDTMGVDLSGCKVIVTEFKIPMTYAWDGKLPVRMESGTEFWFGFFVDDNDEPGSDVQEAYPWPVTYAAFGNPDQGARAVLE